MPRPVNGRKRPRRYDASARRAEAERRRQRALESAREHFVTEGFVATTMGSIASDAGVSVESLYKWFGSKAGLLRSLWDLSLAGSGPVHAERRSDAASAAAEDARAIIRSWSRLAAEVGALADPVHRVVESAAHVDPAAAELFDLIEAERSARMAHNAAYLAEGGYLREDVTPDRARQVLLLYTTLYSRLVVENGWSPEEFSDFVERGLTAHLL